MHLAENLASDSLFAVLVVRDCEFGEQFSELIIVRASCRVEFRERVAVAVNYPVTPALGEGEQALITNLVGIQPGEGGTNRLWVHFPHEFADVLLLSSERAMRFDIGRITNGLVQPLVEREVCKVCLLQLDELLAEFLECELLPLSFAFAGHPISLPHETR